MTDDDDVRIAQFLFEVGTIRDYTGHDFINVLILK